jgi:hypothetical protein
VRFLPPAGVGIIPRPGRASSRACVFDAAAARSVPDARAGASPALW